MSNGLVPVQKRAELQGNFITRSSTSLKVATEWRSPMRHYPFLPVGRKWLGVSGHIWSVAAQGQINNIHSEAFHSFLQILSECWMKRLWFFDTFNVSMVGTRWLAFYSTHKNPSRSAWFACGTWRPRCLKGKKKNHNPVSGDHAPYCFMGTC